MPTSASQAVTEPDFRMTPQRTAVLGVVRAAHDHPTARDIYERVRRDLPGIGFATVYRTLNLLAEHGRILELQLADEAMARYDGNTGHHDHAICDHCGAIADISAPLRHDLLADAADACGFRVSGYELRFNGRCPSC